MTRLGIAAVLKSAGDLPLRQYTRQHARATRDFLMSAGNRTGTVRRRLRTIIAVVNHGISEHAPDIANVFAKLKIPQEATDAAKREPFGPEELRVIAEPANALTTTSGTWSLSCSIQEHGFLRLWDYGVMT